MHNLDGGIQYPAFSERTVDKARQVIFEKKVNPLFDGQGSIYAAEVTSLRTGDVLTVRRYSSGEGEHLGFSCTCTFGAERVESVKCYHAAAFGILLGVIDEEGSYL